MTPSVRCSVVRSWTTWTVNVPRCGTTTVSDRTRTGVPPMVVVWMSRPLVDAAWIPGSYGQAGRDGWIARREDRLAIGTEDHRVRPRSAAAEDEAVAGRVLGVRALALDRRHPGVELGDPGVLERAGRRDVQRDRERDEDEQGRPAAPQDEVAPDVPKQPAVGGLGGEFRRARLGRWQDPVRHRPDDSPPRARSRSACPPNRACRAGSGRRHRPRWA